jgi:exodeoxyribonuclease-5
MIELTDEQMNVATSLIKGTRNKREQSLAGYAGTGKSTVLSYIHNKLPNFAVCAYTGKAANNLKNKGISGASTIHSLIYVPETQEDGSVKFLLRSWKEFQYSGILVDEGSMVPSNLYRDLNTFKVPIIYFGDHGQLEPIGDNPNLMKNPMYKLEKIHRNAGDIARFAEHVRFGRKPSDFVCEDGSVEFKTANEIEDKELLETDQIICAFNKFRTGMNFRIRTLLGRVSLVEVDDRVMCLRNNKELGLFNGMTGIVRAVREGKSIKIDFENEQGKFYNIVVDKKAFGCEKFVPGPFDDRDVMPFDYSWVATCHKMQGDEADKVMVYEQKCDKRDMKRWNYTAASRARKKLTWVTSS